MRAATLSLLLVLTACGPRITVEAVAGRTLMVTNGEDHDLTIERIVANGDDSKAECVDAPGQVVGAGRTYTVTLFGCDAVTSVRVETDSGTAHPPVSSD